MHIIVVGAGVTGIECAHNFLKRGHNVTLIEKASTPNQECSFGYLYGCTGHRRRSCRSAYGRRCQTPRT